MKTVFITGATSGFGEACATVFAQAGYGLVLNGRRMDRLASLKQSLEDEYGVSCHLLPFDVQSRRAVFAAVESLPEEWRTIDVLINNAGLALGRDTFDQANLDDWETMIDTNLKGLLYVSKAVLPLMIARKAGTHHQPRFRGRQGSVRPRERVLCHQSCRGTGIKGHAH